MFASITPTNQEITKHLPGDDIVPSADVVMDRAFTLQAVPEVVWPWFMQLGKNRSGWYFPKSVERFIPKHRRGIWKIDPSLQSLHVGTIIDDWGGKNAYFKVALLEPPYTLVHMSRRGSTDLSWAITLRPEGSTATRVHIRLRLAPVKRKNLAKSVGGFFDAVTIVGLAAGLRQRLAIKHLLK